MLLSDAPCQGVHHLIRDGSVQPLDLNILKDGKLRLRHDLQRKLAGHGLPFPNLIDLYGRVCDRIQGVIFDNLLQGSGEDLLKSLVVERLASDAHLDHAARRVSLAESRDVRTPGNLPERLGKPLGKLGRLELDLNFDDVLLLPQQLRLHLSNSFRAVKQTYYTLNHRQKKSALCSIEPGISRIPAVRLQNNSVFSPSLVEDAYRRPQKS